VAAWQVLALLLGRGWSRPGTGCTAGDQAARPGGKSSDGGSSDEVCSSKERSWKSVAVVMASEHSCLAGGARRAVSTRRGRECGGPRLGCGFSGLDPGGLGESVAAWSPTIFFVSLTNLGSP